MSAKSVCVILGSSLTGLNVMAAYFCVDSGNVTDIE